MKDFYVVHCFMFSFLISTEFSAIFLLEVQYHFKIYSFTVPSTRIVTAYFST